MGSKRKAARTPSDEQKPKRTAEVSSLTSEELKRLVHGLLDDERKAQEIIEELTAKLMREQLTARELYLRVVQLASTPLEDAYEQLCALEKRSIQKIEFTEDEYDEHEVGRSIRKMKREMERGAFRYGAEKRDERRGSKKTAKWQHKLLTEMERTVVKGIKDHSEPLLTSISIHRRHDFPMFQHLRANASPGEEPEERYHVIFILHENVAGMEKETKIKKDAIRYYLSKWAKEGKIIKLGRLGSTGATVYGVGYHGDYGRVWLFSEKRFKVRVN